MVIVATSPMSQEVSGHEANNSTDETIDDVLTFWPQAPLMSPF